MINFDCTMKTKRLHRILLLFLAICSLTVLSCSKEKLVQENEISTQPSQEQTDEPEGDEPGNPEDEPQEPWDECGYQEEGDPYGGNLVELNFTAEAPTKTTFDGDKHVYWVAGDQVRFDASYQEEGKDTKSIVNYKTTAKSTGSTTAFEAVNVRDDVLDYLYVTYPASAATYHSANVSGTPRVRIWFPAEPASGTFAAADFSLAKTTRSDDVWNTTLSFQNVAAIFKIGISDPDITKIVVSSEGGEYIAGELEYRITAGGALQDKGSLETNDKRSSSITLNIDGTGTYYIAAVPCTLSTGFRVTPYKGAVAQTPFCYPIEYILERGKFTTLKSVDTHATKDYYVSVSGSGRKTGHNSANAMDKNQFKTLVAAQSTSDDAAWKAALLNGTTFHFAAGTYNLGEMVELGFLGQTSSVPSLTFEGTEANGDTTVFTGNSEHRIFNIDSPINLSINKCKFIEGTGGESGGEAGAIRLQQINSTLKLTNCQFWNNSNDNGDSGALMLGNGTTTIKDCSFAFNSASNHGSAIGFTGAGDIRVIDTEFKGNDGASLRFHNVNSFAASGLTFKGNTGSCIRVLEANDMDLEFTDCTFLNNTDGGGAVLYNRGGSTVTFNGTTAMTNCHSTAFGGGAIVMRIVNKVEGVDTESSTSGNLTITGNCTIDGCYGTADGGAMYLNTTGDVNIGDPDHSDSTVVIKNCYTSSANGGGVALVAAGDFAFSHTTFKANHTDQGGGAVYTANGAASYNFTDCLFEGNYATGAGGASDDHHAGAVIYATQGGTVVNFTNTTMKGNYNYFSTNLDPVYGGIIRFNSSQAKGLFNGCVFDGNYSNRKYSKNTNCAAIINNRLGTTFYFNACEFKENTSGTGNSEDVYGGVRGTVIANLGSAKIGLNNCSFHDNYGGRNTDDITWICMDNASCTFTLANSTIVGDNYRAPDAGGARKNNWGVVKFHNKGNFYLLNSILCSYETSGNSFWVNGDIIVDGSTSIAEGGTKLPVTSYYCKTSKEGDNRTNWIVDTGSGHNYTANSTSFSGYVAPGVSPNYYKYMYWTGTMTGTNSGMKAVTADVNTQINSADSDFYTWLNSIGALGKDINGRSRGATSWPGCYQN